MADESHPAVRATHDAASAVLLHGEREAPLSFRQRLFPPRRGHLYDKVREFGRVLSHLLDVPPTMLSPGDIAAIGADVDQVVQRAEQEIERNDRSSGEPIASFPPTIYAIRARYEEIYRRGGTRHA